MPDRPWRSRWAKDAAKLDARASRGWRASRQWVSSPVCSSALAATARSRRGRVHMQQRKRARPTPSQVCRTAPTQLLLPTTRASPTRQSAQAESPAPRQAKSRRSRERPKRAPLTSRMTRDHPEQPCPGRAAAAAVRSQEGSRRSISANSSYLRRHAANPRGQSVLLHRRRCPRRLSPRRPSRRSPR
jgi:hypothetical protein